MMTSQSYKIIFEGCILEGCDAEEVKKNLAAFFKISVERIEKYFVGRPVVIRKNADHQTAVKIERAFRDAGAVCRAEPIVETSVDEIPKLEMEQESPALESSAPETMECPKCGFQQEKAEECAHCGIVIAKFVQKTPSHSTQVEGKGDPVVAAEMLRKTVRQQSQKGFLRVAVPLALVATLSFYLFFWFVEPRLNARNFIDVLTDFGARELTIPLDTRAVSEGQIPYRVGKVFVVEPEHTIWISREGEKVPPKIHPSWYRLNRSIRAFEPEEVRTLIRIRKKLRGARLYMTDIARDGLLTRTKVVDNHVLILDVYDWVNETYIGSWFFDPGGFKGDTMTEDELEEMVEATSSSAVSKFIESMPEI